MNLKYKQIELIDKDKQKYFDENIDYSSMLLRIESTNNCNFKCTFCPHPTMERAKGYMDEKLFKKVIDQASALGFLKLDLRNFGEPMLDKRLSKFAEYACSKGLENIYIHTNGYGISKKKVDEWGSSGIKDVNISLSPKREFSISRPGIDANRLFNDIENVMTGDSEWKNILSTDYIRTGLSTKEEEKEFFDWLKKIHLSKRIDIELHNWANGEAKKYIQCHRLWTSITVLFDGRVSLCCLDYEGEIQLGNLNNQSLKDVAESEIYKQIRINHVNGIFLDKCSACDMPTIKDFGVMPEFSKIDLKE